MSAPEISHTYNGDDEATEFLLVSSGGTDNEGVETKLQGRGLRKESDAGATILSGVDVDIPAGRIVGIVGPSGSGKSMFLRVVNRLWEPPRGTVMLDDRDICDLDVVNLSHRKNVLDEPTSALDTISTQNIEDALVKLKKCGMTIVLVSHSIKQIQRVADLVCLLENGTIVEVLEPDKLGQAKHPVALQFLDISA